jgi:hypothetical protein
MLDIRTRDSELFSSLTAMMVGDLQHLISVHLSCKEANENTEWSPRGCVQGVPRFHFRSGADIAPYN